MAVRNTIQNKNDTGPAEQPNYDSRHKKSRPAMALPTNTPTKQALADCAVMLVKSDSKLSLKRYAEPVWVKIAATMPMIVRLFNIGFVLFFVPTAWLMGRPGFAVEIPAGRWWAEISIRYTACRQRGRGDRWCGLRHAAKYHCKSSYRGRRR
jgi:hypothetical protein